MNNPLLWPPISFKYISRFVLAGFRPATTFIHNFHTHPGEVESKRTNCDKVIRSPRSRFSSAMLHAGYIPKYAQHYQQLCHDCDVFPSFPLPATARASQFDIGYAVAPFPPPPPPTKSIPIPRLIEHHTALAPPPRPQLPRALTPIDPTADLFLTTKPGSNPFKAHTRTRSRYFSSPSKLDSLPEGNQTVFSKHNAMASSGDTYSIPSTIPNSSIAIAASAPSLTSSCTSLSESDSLSPPPAIPDLTSCHLIGNDLLNTIHESIELVSPYTEAEAARIQEGVAWREEKLRMEGCVKIEDGHGGEILFRDVEWEGDEMRGPQGSGMSGGKRGKVRAERWGRQLKKGRAGRAMKSNETERDARAQQWRDALKGRYRDD